MPEKQPPCHTGFQRYRRTFTISVSSGAWPNMHQIRTYTVAAVAAVICITGALPVAAHAQSCPANPNALGTTRILVVAPTDYMRLGTMRYPETLPLADKEVVLTFDDGPLPPYSNKILDILTTECVKATFFIIGRMAPGRERRLSAHARRSSRGCGYAWRDRLR
jgi:peptidoglycan/xylan/chitin deacetylase (PgdA/CDA1 family)